MLTARWLAADRAAGQDAEEKEKMDSLPPFEVLLWLRKHGVALKPKLTKRQKVRKGVDAETARPRTPLRTTVEAKVGVRA
jgi:hypothetical protein